jgi:hypothetical protein
VNFGPLALALAWTATTWIAVGSVYASPASESEALIKKANALRRIGDDEGALPLIRQAYEINPSPRMTAQLGLVEWALGRWVEADDHLTEVLKPGGTDPWVRANRQVLEEALGVAKRNIGRVEINGDPPGAEVLVNGRTVGKLPLAGPVRVIAGSVDVELRAPGYRTMLRTLTVSGQQYQPVVIRLEKAEQPRLLPPPPLSSAGQPTARAGAVSPGDSDLVVAMPIWRKTVIGAALGGAALGLGASAYGIWRHNDQVDAFNQRRCVETRDGAILVSTRAPDGRCLELRSRFRSAKVMSIATLSAAGVLGLTAVALYLTGGNTFGGHANADSHFRLTCAPDLGGGGTLCALAF